MGDDYNKSGVASDGSIDPLRGMVAGLMHVLAGPGVNSSGFRKIGDDLYQSMKTGEDVGGWKSSGAASGSDDNKKSSGPGIKDIDYKVSVGRVKPTNLNAGGIVRGGGKAERGRGRGKMV